jgi:hypothetical protein
MRIDLTDGLPHALTTRQECKGQLRWVAGEKFDWEKRLQQLWRVTTYRNGVPVNVHDEWREIPVAPFGAADRGR